MKKSVLFALAGAFLLSGTVQAENLLQAFELALASDPQLREAEANRMAALEAKPQARAALLPQLNFTWDKTLANDSEGISSQPDGQGSFFETPFSRDREGDSYTLRLRQSVFRWDQWVALRQADARIAQAEVDYRAAVQDLMLRVAQRYFAVLASVDSLESTQATKEAVARQLEQAETRFEVGLIAVTDVREAQAAYDTAIADEIAAKRSLGTAKEELREVTGHFIDVLDAPAENLPMIPPEPRDSEAWVNTAMEQNLSLTSSRLAVDIAQEETGSRRAGHYPTLDLVVTRNETSDVTDTFSTVSARGLKDDFSNDSITLNLSVPIYSGGSVSSSVREAVHLERAAKERLERVARETQRVTRDSYEGVISEISRVAALNRALESSATALEATEAGFEVGTRTTVDVLNARRDQFNARTSYLRSRYDYILNVLSLQQAAGTLSTEDLQEVNRWLN